MPERLNAMARLPEMGEPIQELLKTAQNSGAPAETLALVHLRASQVNGCGPCVVGGVLKAKKDGETDERLGAVAVWRETPYFTAAERAALALAEEATRLADRADAVPDPVWDEAAEHFDEKALAGIVLMIGVTNMFNRLNVATRQQAGKTW